MKTMRFKKTGFIVQVAVIAVMVHIPVAGEAATRYFDVSSGNWTNPASWDVGTLPAPADVIRLGDSGGAADATCEVDSTGVVYNLLYMGFSASDRGELNITAGDLTGGASFIGYDGNGTLNLSSSALYRITGTMQVGSRTGSTGVVNQTGGLWDSAGQQLYVGDDAGANGAFNLSGSAVLTNAGFLAFGYDGNGTFNLSDSAVFHKSGTGTWVGDRQGSTGVMNIMGGLFNNVSQGLYIGDDVGTTAPNAEGTLNLSGSGVLTNCGLIYVGQSGNGTFNLSDSAQLIRAGGESFVANGASSTGVVNQTGGLWNNDNQKLTIGKTTGAEGTINLSGSGVMTNFSVVIVAAAGNGTFNLSDSAQLIKTGSSTMVGESAGGAGVVHQTGGLWNNGTGSLYLGWGSGANGTFTLSGSGVMTNCGTTFIGFNGNGTLNLSGDAEWWRSGTIYVGDNNGSIGVVNQTGGLWNNGNNQLYIGLDSGANGTVTLSGSAVLSDCNYIGVGHNGNGTLSLSDDAKILKTGSKTFVGNAKGSIGVVTLTGGLWDNAGGEFTIGDDPGALGLPNAEGTLSLSGSAVITNCGLMYVGQSGSGTLNLSGNAKILRSSGTAYVANGGVSTGVVNQTGGLWDNNGATFTIGDDAGSVGTIHLSGSGVMTNCGLLYLGFSGNGSINLSDSAVFHRSSGTALVGVGGGGTGVVNQTGGLWRNNDADLYLGYNAGANGTYSISGGALTNVVVLYNPRDGVGTFSVAGSTASIHVGTYLEKTAASTLRVAPDADGLSPVNVSGNVTLNGTLEVDFSNYVGTDPITIIDYNGNRTGAFAATNIVTAGWLADIEYNENIGGPLQDTVRLINIVAPPVFDGIMIIVQ